MANRHSRRLWRNLAARTRGGSFTVRLLLAGASYRVLGTLVSADVLYGSGLRSGFANTGTVAPHAIVNLGISRDVTLMPGTKPTTLRLTLVNLLDNSYGIRDGSGIGVFAAQYGERRGLFGGITQRF